jgi:hypothetical protein
MQRQQGIENIETYHTVFADSLRMIVDAISRKDPNLPQMLAKYNIWYAYSMWACDRDMDITPEEISKEIQALNLDKKTLPELVVLMTFYQSKAGLKAVQERDLRAKLFERFNKTKPGALTEQ